MPSVNMRISKDGEVSIEVSGMTGVGCEEMTRSFQEALGVTTETQRAPEFYLDELTSEVQVFEHD